MGIKKVPTAKGTKYRAYWRNPVTRKKEYGPRTTMLKAEKLDELMKYRLKYEREFFEPEDKAADKDCGDLTVEAVCALYNSTAQMSDSSRKNNFYHIKNIAPFLGDVYVSELERKHIKALEKHLRIEHGLKQNTINRKVSIIRSALAWAADEEQGLIPTNPIEGYVCKRGKDKKYEPPTREEAEAIFQAAAPHVRRCIIIGWHTGVRIGPSELLKMQWKRFTTTPANKALPAYASATVYLRLMFQWLAEKLIPEEALRQNGVLAWLEESGDALLVAEDVAKRLDRLGEIPVSGRFRIMAALKNDNMPWRELPIEGEVLPVILQWRDADAEKGIRWVIHYKGQKISTFKKAWKAAKRRADVRDDIRPYDLRHAFITYALEQGADMKAVGKLAGHADETMILRRYQHVVGEMETEAAKAIPTLDMAPKTGPQNWPPKSDNSAASSGATPKKLQ